MIANLEARLVETEDKYWGPISAINENFVNIPESIVRQYPMLLSGGMWGTIDLTWEGLNRRFALPSRPEL